MKREDAAVIVATLAAGYPHESFETATLNLWTDEIASLHDADIATRLCRSLIRSEAKLPSLALFREAYMVEARREAEHTAATRGLPEPRATDIPEWVQVWKWARAQGETRGFPQQHGYCDPLSEMTQVQYEGVMEAWKADNAPTQNIDELLAV